jgi:tetratricopeptide (TPR) repeat protein
MQKAAALIDHGHPRTAVPMLRRVTSLDPGSALAHFSLGLSLLHCGDTAGAIDSLAHAVKLQPDHALAHFNLGVALECQGRALLAIDSYRAAASHDPKMLRAHERLGQLLEQNNRMDEAIAAHRAAAAASPDNTAGQLNLARAYLLQEDIAAAEQTLRVIVARDPSSAQALELLGWAASISGRKSDAVEYSLRSIEIDPRRVNAYLTITSARPATPDDTGLIDRMKAVLADATLSTPERVTMHFALGKAMEDRGDYAEAMRQFDTGNSLRGALLVYDPRRIAQQIDRAINTYTPAFFASHRDVVSEDDRPVFVMGMPRSGTTLVEQIISSHPAVVAGGELLFWLNQGNGWERPDADTVLANARQTIGGYSAVMQRISPRAARIIDKMTFTFLWVGEIHLLFPRARFINCIRNPVDVCLSNYTMRFQSTPSFITERKNLVHFYRQYERLVAHWRSVLPADRYIDVQHEALVNDPVSGSRRLIGFCGLDWDEACLRPQDNRRVVRTASAWQVRQPINRSGLERWRRYEPWLGELRELLPGE